MADPLKQPAAQKDDWMRALEAIEYPTSIIPVRRSVMDVGGLDREVLDVLNRIDGDADFETEEDLIGAVRSVYAADEMQSPV